MKATVAVYDSHEKALSALQALQKSGFPMKEVSLVGKAEVIDDHLHVNALNTAIAAPVAISATIGPVVGVLTGAGIFAIPGFGFLYGAGAALGALAGFDFGLIGGTIISVLTTLGLKKEKVKYEEHIKSGKFLVIVQGSNEEIENAEHILRTEGTHLEMETH